METIKIYSLLFFLSMLWSCRQASSPEEIVRSVKAPDSGFRNSIEVGNIAISAMYKPVFYTRAIALMNGLEDGTQPKDPIPDDSYSFEVRFDVKQPGVDLTNIGLKDQSEFAERIDYLSFGMAKDVMLLCGKDTLESELFHFERDYQVSDKNIFTVVFPKKPIQEDVYLHIYPRFLNCGPVKLKFEQKLFKKSTSNL